jgi:3-hydroxyisobutyrate dehydrogenase-like beta-hydroxyacid dehydrogenase
VHVEVVQRCLSVVVRLSSCDRVGCREVAQRSDVIIICVTDSPDVVAVAHGGLFEHAKKGAVIVDMSTIR